MYLLCELLKTNCSKCSIPLSSYVVLDLGFVYTESEYHRDRILVKQLEFFDHLMEKAVHLTMRLQSGMSSPSSAMDVANYSPQYL